MQRGWVAAGQRRSQLRPRRPRHHARSQGAAGCTHAAASCTLCRTWAAAKQPPCSQAALRQLTQPQRCTRGSGTPSSHTRWRQRRRNHLASVCSTSCRSASQTGGSYHCSHRSCCSHSSLIAAARQAAPQCQPQHQPPPATTSPAADSRPMTAAACSRSRRAQPVHAAAGQTQHRIWRGGRQPSCCFRSGGGGEQRLRR